MQRTAVIRSPYGARVSPEPDPSPALEKRKGPRIARPGARGWFGQRRRWVPRTGDTSGRHGRRSGPTRTPPPPKRQGSRSMDHLLRPGVEERRVPSLPASRAPDTRSAAAALSRRGVETRMDASGAAVNPAGARVIVPFEFGRGARPRGTLGRSRFSSRSPSLPPRSAPEGALGDRHHRFPRELRRCLVRSAAGNRRNLLRNRWCLSPSLSFAHACHRFRLPFFS